MRSFVHHLQQVSFDPGQEDLWPLRGRLDGLAPGHDAGQKQGGATDEKGEWPEQTEDVFERGHSVILLHAGRRVLE